MEPKTLLFLSGADVRRALPMPAAIEAVTEAFRSLSAGRALVPPRLHLALPPRDRTVLVMPAWLTGADTLSVKVIALYGENPSRGLPLAHALVMVFDAETGQPRAVIDGGALTALRTGAASGAATALLARADADAAAVIGAGRQGRSQLEAVCAVRPVRRAAVFDPDGNAAAAFAAEMAAALRIPVTPARSADDAVARADIVCTATPFGTPVFDDAAVRPGTHINAVGAYTPTQREIPGATASRARLTVDSRAACLEEAGDLLIPLGEGLIGPPDTWAELGEIAAGSRAGRQSADEITLFKSVGLAVQDAAAATVTLREAESLGLGAKIEL
jgi:ornithine cyclodeaminase/alanine dehydrogenase-like protein (mu-crystallin family)